MTEAIKLNPDNIQELVSISQATGIPMLDLQALAKKGSYFSLNHETKAWMIIPAEDVESDINNIMEETDNG